MGASSFFRPLVSASLRLGRLALHRAAADHTRAAPLHTTRVRTIYSLYP
jgi:hypothetical protein